MNRALLTLCLPSLIAVSSFLPACGSDDSAAATSAKCDPTDPKLSLIKTRIFDKSCALSNCHKPGDSKNGVSLSGATTLADLLNKPAKDDSAQKLVVAGDPRSSLLYQKLVGDFDNCKNSKACIGLMPPLKGGQCAEDIAAIKTWIEMGALDN